MPRGRKKTIFGEYCSIKKDKPSGHCVATVKRLGYHKYYYSRNELPTFLVDRDDLRAMGMQHKVIRKLEPVAYVLSCHRYNRYLYDIRQIHLRKLYLFPSNCRQDLSIYQFYYGVDATFDCGIWYGERTVIRPMADYLQLVIPGVLELNSVA